MDDMLSGVAPAADKAEAAAKSPYRVLARKYRPLDFSALIGHGPMVRTLANAFAADRIAQGWMLTGVRGVGKTTTARILARALNYEVPGKAERPTTEMPEFGLHCQAILEGRHVDVIEMDAASHTGINDIREIIEASQYKPVSARYKVYIIDEVHMLSGPAFNGLLKTLEEPPAHVKFIFATTEIRKVPITVLSRVQRFDLRRVDAELIAGHLGRIAAAEGVMIDDEALALIARAAEGSVRDALTMLDQAIAHAGGGIAADAVRDMLGLADRSRVIDLFEAAMRGDVPVALAELGRQYDNGADPAAVLGDLASFTHLVTRVKLVPDAAKGGLLSEAERTRSRTFAEALSVRVLSRTWQLLLKGITEVQEAPKPLAAAEMVLVRLAYAADLPTPDEALRRLAGDRNGAAPAGGAPASSGGSAPGPRPVPQMRALPGGNAAPAPRPREATPPATAPAPPPLASFEALVALAREKRDVALVHALERQVRLVRFEPGLIEIAPIAEASRDLAGDLGRKLGEWTGSRWVVSIAREVATPAPTLHEAREAARERLVTDARSDPVVAAIMAAFPGAEIVDVRPPKTAANAGLTVDGGLPADDMGETAPESGEDDPF